MLDNNVVRSVEPLGFSDQLITGFSLYGEYVVRFFLPDGVFYLVATGWIFYISLCENPINSINEKQSIK